MNLRSNIVLIGMPGAGKSTAGVVLAKVTGRSFLDTDVLIQEREKRTLQEIVNTDGYQKLRAIEEDVLCSIDVKNMVIATGGSAVYSPAAMARLRRGGVVVYLKVSLAEVKKRVTNESSRGLARPPGQVLADVYREREPLYRRFADCTVSAATDSVDATAHAVCTALASQ